MPKNTQRKSRREIAKGGPNERPRLQKFIAEAGLCSRRKAEEWITDGRVTVNGERVELGRRVDANADVVRINGKRVNVRKGNKVVLVMNKPRGYACTNEDPHADLIVIDLLPKRYAGHRLFCAGRLDKDSEGLLILTDDGSLAHRLTHPSTEVKKIYNLKLSRPLDLDHITLLEKGKVVEGELLRIDKIRTHKSNKVPLGKVKVEMGHGKKREIRRLFAAFGYRVERLKRVRIGRFSIRNLSRGQVRELSPEEIDLLFAQEPVNARTSWQSR